MDIYIHGNPAVFPYLPNTSFFSFFGMLRVLVVFGLNATLIFSLIIIIIIAPHAAFTLLLFSCKLGASLV